jgi:hypothetical protein
MIRISGKSVMGKAENSPAHVEPTSRETPVMIRMINVAIMALRNKTLWDKFILSRIVTFLISLNKYTNSITELLGINIARNLFMLTKCRIQITTKYPITAKIEAIKIFHLSKSKIDLK